MQSVESLSMSFQLSGNTHIASLCVLAKTRDIKVQDTAEPQLNMDQPTDEPAKKWPKPRKAGVATLVTGVSCTQSRNKLVCKMLQLMVGEQAGD